MIEILRIQHYSKDLSELKRITLAPHKINIVSADLEDVILNGLSVRPVVIYFDDGGQIDVVINHSDLELLERAVGAFMLE